MGASLLVSPADLAEMQSLNAANLIDAAYALTPTETDGPGGTTVTTWALSTTAIACRAKPMTATERVTADQLHPGADWLVVFAAGTTSLAPRYRVVTVRGDATVTVDLDMGAPPELQRTMTKATGKAQPRLTAVT